ncbi:ATP-binding cassette domain-containing protein [Waterburya agarophytonicola K14]|uniref:ATP-binding cassette domain-containing protein n=1 Tax=Waterburya agarophytonicola KI4 TaxID=2874699 RepID=A0A964BP71_9CYAN|nr:ATP-binding cassette domain-containing protein [Waterburya agarophytonicola]MCC0175958.1 ATP-binding cassette domain-containing protein [Waterburya agarophytonicola KI4]
MTGNYSDRTTVANTTPYIELDNQGRKEILNLRDGINCLGRDPNWANIQTPQDWNVVSRKQATIEQEGSGFRIYDGDRNSQKASGNGIFLNQSRINLTDGYLLKNGEQLHIGQDPRYQISLTYFNPKLGEMSIPSVRKLSLKGLQNWPVELGRSPNPHSTSSMELDAPTVSRLHATINPDGKGGYILKDSSSSNGTFVNGNRIDKSCTLNKDDTIQIGPYVLLFTGESLELTNATNQIRLDAHKLNFRVKDKKGDTFTILNDVYLVLEPGQLVAFVGGSGAGKSTLMKALLGIAPISSGNVYLNGDNLRKNWPIYRSQVGYVPQDDIIHRELTVEEVLRSACQLRLPPDTNISKVITNTLDQIKLSHVRNTLVSRLSGGQRKRVSIGVELLADPKLFFLDEPTSGLDPGLDKEMMQLLREQADRGRTIALVTHATDNIGICDRIAFMGLGGSLCFYGPPAEALPFFQRYAGNFESEHFGDFADIYIELNKGKDKAAITERVAYWSEKFANSPEYKSYIQNSLSPGKENQQGAKSNSTKTGISPIAQLSLLCKRYWKLVSRDTTSLILTLLAGPITIALTGLPLKNEQPLSVLSEPGITQGSLALRLLFIFSCVAIWIGLSNSIREIVKESAIYFRERLLNLGLLPYFSSKLFIRGGLALAQTLLITAIVLLIFDAPESELIPWSLGFFITTFLTLLASTSLSLMLSAFVKTENEGNGILPLIMIPQIIFSGVLFNLEGWSSKLSWLMLSRWSIGAYGSLADVNAMAPKPNPILTQEIINDIFKASDVYNPTWDNLGLNWGVLIAHTLIYAVIALIVQRRKDIF